MSSIHVSAGSCLFGVPLIWGPRADARDMWIEWSKVEINPGLGSPGYEVLENGTLVNHNYPGFSGWLGTFLFLVSLVELPILGASRLFFWPPYFGCFLPFGDSLHLAENTQLATGPTLEESHNYSGNTSTCSSSRRLIVQGLISLRRRWSPQKTLSLGQRVRTESNGHMIDGNAAISLAGRYIFPKRCTIEAHGRGDESTMNEWLGRRSRKYGHSA